MNPPGEPSLIPAPLAMLISRLPQWPHSAALAAVLNLAVLPVLDAETRRRLADRPLAIQILDVGVDCRVCLKPIGFVPLTRRHPPAVSIRASAADFYRLARRLEDPDTLFFARRLIIEGDTELGLCLKNALDAIDWTRFPAELLNTIVRTAMSFAPDAARRTNRPPRPNG
jgi:O2-independent ubiquinone biosynthesis accessory factor UbiT